MSEYRFDTVPEVREGLRKVDYLADEGIAGVVYRPLSDVGEIDLVVACDAANRTPPVDHALRVLRAIA